MLNVRRVDLDVAKAAAAAKKPEGEKGERQQAVRTGLKMLCVVTVSSSFSHLHF